MLGYGFSWAAFLFGFLYLACMFTEMYVRMPLLVCPNCVYYRMENSLCISGLNIISRRFAKQGDPKNFPNRAKGIFCPNNLYVASLVIPIIAMIPALIINFSSALLVIFVAVVGLLLFRFFVIFTRIACIHCRAKNICPQAEQMGVREM